VRGERKHTEEAEPPKDSRFVVFGKSGILFLGLGRAAKRLCLVREAGDIDGDEDVAEIAREHGVAVDRVTNHAPPSTDPRACALIWGALRRHEGSATGQKA
jgi:hypothetical protein